MNILLVGQHQGIEEMVKSQVQPLPRKNTDPDFVQIMTPKKLGEALNSHSFDFVIMRFSPGNASHNEAIEAVKKHFDGRFVMAHCVPGIMIFGRQEHDSNENQETADYNSWVMQTCYQIQKRSVEITNDSNLKHLFVKSDSKLVKLNFCDIQWIEANGDYLAIKTRDRKIIALSTMKNIEKRLPYGDFLRVHRSFIININHITSVQNTIVEIEDKIINLGETYRSGFF